MRRDTSTVGRRDPPRRQPLAIGARERVSARPGQDEDHLVAHLNRRGGAGGLARRWPTRSWPRIRTSKSRSPCSRTRRSRPSSPPRCNPATRRTSSRAGAAACSISMPTPAWSRTSPPISRTDGWGDTFLPGRARSLRHRWQELRRALERRHGRLLVQQGALRPGRHRSAAGHLGRVPDAVTDAQGRRDHADHRRREATSGPATSTGSIWRPATAARPPSTPPTTAKARSPIRRSSRPAPSSRSWSTCEPFQEGFLGAGLQRRRGADRQRQGRDGADGPVVARQPEVAGRERRQGLATISASSPSRWSRAARATRPMCSAAATALRSARMRRRKRSTSSAS